MSEAESLDGLPVPSKQFHVEGPVSPGGLSGLRMNEQLQNFRLPEKQHQALIKIAGFAIGMVFVAVHAGEIVGYITFHRPDEYARWYRHPRVLELGGIEVARSWRRCGVGTDMLRAAFSLEVFEQWIVITTEYFRHWDVKGNNMTVWQYRELLTKLFGRVGFVERATSDPDIIEHPANVLMARCGSRVSWDDMMLFEQLLMEKVRWKR
ncbi:GNAT family N-acetyltransferase [Desulfotomaculum copahuensis]|uniref:GNAT family N-acetyltransferase n=1 Tax=Desulfotomaculum copahuensis TaxID=1838280 RepID=UPI000A7735C8|nr:GNAT family N-acetyltransferase [Desulfotomaculum copahuensis]